MTTELSPLQKKILATEIDKTKLTLLGMDPLYIEVLVRNNVLPCTLEQFVKIEGTWLTPMVELLKGAVSFNDDGTIDYVRYQHGVESFTYEADKIVGVINTGGYLLAAEYRTDGQTTKTYTATAAGEVISVLYEASFNKHGRLREEIEPIMVDGENGLQETASVTVKRYIFNGESSPSEEVSATVELTSKGKLPKIDRDAFMREVRYEYNEGVMVAAIYDTGEFNQQEARFEFHWDEHSNLYKQTLDGKVMEECKLDYDDTGRLMVLNVLTKKADDGRVVTVEPDEQPRLVLTNFWA